MVLVDINYAVLQGCMHVMTPSVHHDRPTRRTPLTVEIFQGNVIDNDEKLINADVVTCIEL